MRYDMDVFIVGGGPAGLAAAIAASARGFRVTVADGNTPPITKACGEGLLPDAMKALAELGVSLRKSDGFTLRGIRFEDNTASVRADFPVGYGKGLRREILHARLLKQAADHGVNFLWNAPITGLDSEGVTVGRNKLRAKWVIGADGSRSRVRHWAGLESRGRGVGRSAFRQHFRAKPWSDLAEIHWVDRAQAYVTPVANDEICVAIISNRPELRVREAFQVFPRLAGRLKDSPVASRERGALTGMFELPRVYRGNVALVGDASGGVDAVTGEGLCLSFRQAMALANAMVAGTLEHYQKAHRRLFRRPRFIGNLMLLMDRRSFLRKRTLRAMQAAPHLFQGMLAYHVGATRFPQLATTGASLWWRFLMA